jgi:subtilisin family serine protease
MQAGGRWSHLTVIAALLVALVFVGAAAFAATNAELRRVVAFQDDTPWPVQQEVVAQSGSRLLHALPLVNGVSVELPAIGTDAAVAFLTTHPAVVGVYDDPAVGVHADVGAIAQGAGGDGAGGDGTVFLTPVPAPSSEIYPWGIIRIGAVDLENYRHDLGDGVKVAVFDTGVDRTHPDLATAIVGGFNAIADADPQAYDDDNGHGTAMAGIIAAQVNSVGIIGGAPHANIYAVKVLDRDGRGHTSDTIYALGEIANRADIRVINMSFGTSLVWPLFPVAIQRAVDLGKILVVSRGNGCTPAPATAQGAGGDGAGGDGAGGDAGCDPFSVKYPAAYRDVIAVGATTAGDPVASYSLWSVDVVAPGGDSTNKILTTNVGGGYGLIMGTSPAAAHVSAAAALALKLRPTLSPAEVQELLQRTAQHLACCTVDQQGAGLIDLRALADDLLGIVPGP